MPAFVFGRTTGCISFFVLVMDILCIIQIAETSKSTLKKALWIALVIFFPFVGALVWLLLGKK